MATHPRDTPRSSQARRGNQNATKHGLYSAIEPPDADQLAAAARQAAEAEDVTLLRAAARGYQALARELESTGERAAGAKRRETGRRLLALARKYERSQIAQHADQLLAEHSPVR